MGHALILVSRAIPLLALACSMPARGQNLLQASAPGEPLRLLPSDARVLDSDEASSDLPCTVRPVAPELGLDLRFHAGYDVSVPLEALADAGNILRVIFRVTPEGGSTGPVYFLQKWSVPVVEEDTRGYARMGGSFVMGEGRYRVDWLMRAQSDQFCSVSWEISAALRGKERQIGLRLLPGMVEAESSLFGEEEPIERDAVQPLTVLVLMHVAPQEDGAVALRPAETLALASILRNIAREPRIGRLSITAFNVEQAKVLYRQDNTTRVDFPALEQGIAQLQPQTIAFDRLRAKDGGSSFLAGLVSSEAARHRPDALVFIGPKTLPHAGAVRDSLKALGEPKCPVFYLNYTTAWGTNLWRDVVGSIVKQWRGIEYTITKPGDLFFAWEQIMSSLPRGKPAAGDAPQPAAMNGSVPHLSGGRNFQKQHE